MSNLAAPAGPRTITVPGDGTNTLSVTLPPGVTLDVQAVLANIDAAGAGDTLAELTIAEQAGVVIATKRQGEPIPAGDTGTATWALRLDGEAGPATPPLAVTDGPLTINPTTLIATGRGLRLTSGGPATAVVEEAAIPYVAVYANPVAVPGNGAAGVVNFRPPSPDISSATNDIANPAVYIGASGWRTDRGQIFTNAAGWDGEFFTSIAAQVYNPFLIKPRAGLYMLEVGVVLGVVGAAGSLYVGMVLPTANVGAPFGTVWQPYNILNYLYLPQPIQAGLPTFARRSWHYLAPGTGTTTGNGEVAVILAQDTGIATTAAVSVRCFRLSRAASP